MAKESMFLEKMASIYTCANPRLLDPVVEALKSKAKSHEKLRGGRFGSANGQGQKPGRTWEMAQMGNTWMERRGKLRLGFWQGWDKPTNASPKRWVRSKERFVNK